MISDSGSVGADAGTIEFGSAPVASEVETSVLTQHATDAGINRPTGPTTVLPGMQTPGTTRESSKPKRRGFIIAPIALAVAVIAVAGYFYFS